VGAQGKSGRVGRRRAPPAYACVQALLGCGWLWWGVVYTPSGTVCCIRDSLKHKHKAMRRRAARGAVAVAAAAGGVDGGGAPLGWGRRNRTTHNQNPGTREPGREPGVQKYPLCWCCRLCRGAGGRRRATHACTRGVSGRVDTPRALPVGSQKRVPFFAHVCPCVRHKNRRAAGAAPQPQVGCLLCKKAVCQGGRARKKRARKPPCRDRPRGLMCSNSLRAGTPL
jgi:hypothetical protein